jgi:hypothetical protein
MTKLDDLFLRVEDEMRYATLIAWDGCHKIYLAMDETEAQWFRDEYEHTFQGTAEEMTKTVRDWYENSCSLRFIQAVSHNPENPNDGFVSLISQFEDSDDYEDEEF